ncbi:enoyl-CoA hydratase/isomerase family protein [Paraburkholderia caffeinilytica]|uniref:enoyl-CoA hydratase/isomerase family protein n=1 Tax=Paraburkholderia caffeinilytica TaxID=1761016 RepID=UPI0038B9B145
MNEPKTGVSFTLRGHAGVIMMHDEAHHNALSTVQVAALLQAISNSRQLGARVLIIASGIRNFCAGADISEMLGGNWLRPGAAPADSMTPLALFKVLIGEARPVIAAVDGLALGGGLELLLSCDLVLASGNARFAMPEIGLGVIPRTALARLPEIVGRRKALELILTRRRFDANEALGMGLVNELVDSTLLIDRAVAVAHEIGTCPPAAIAAVKASLGRVAPADWASIDALLGSMDPAEWQEGFSAFLTKRSPDYASFWSAMLCA